MSLKGFFADIRSKNKISTLQFSNLTNPAAPRNDASGWTSDVIAVSARLSPFNVAFDDGSFDDDFFNDDT